MLAVSLDTLITFNPTAVQPDTPLAEAVQLMEEFGVRHLPTIDGNGRVIGMLSAEDVLRWNLSRESVVGENGAARPAYSGKVFCDTVADVMHPSPVTVDRGVSVQQVLDTLLTNGFHSLPVIDDGRLIGIITSADLLREFAYSGDPVGQELVSEFMHDAEAHIEWDATLDEAARQMLELRLTHLAVLRGECPVGVISKHTLRVLPGDLTASGRTLTVGNVAKTKFRALSPTDTLATAAARLVEEGVSAAPVVDRQSRFVGLLTEDRLLTVMAFVDVLSTSP